MRKHRTLAFIPALAVLMTSGAALAQFQEEYHGRTTCTGAHDRCVQAARNFGVNPNQICSSVAQCRRDRVFRYREFGANFDVPIDDPSK
jgi:hypothetical protein